MKKPSAHVRNLLSLISALMLACAVAAASLLFYLRAQALPASTLSLTSQMYDRNGELIAAFYKDQNRSMVPLEQISPWVIRATLAIEDRRFYDHFGLDLRGMLRASAVNLAQMDKVQGASTITQQLARNMFLSHERTWKRKIREALLSLQLEMKYSKDEILEQYLNQIYYGHSAYGIQAAARLYFDKDASDLSLAESALLAGVPKGPLYYSPFLHPDSAKERQRIVLKAMADYGYITPEQAEEAYREPLQYASRQKEDQHGAPYFRDYVRRVVTEQLGMDERLFEQGGIRIYTTLDLRAQRAAEEAVAKYLDGQNPELQAALVAIDPFSGHILAMVGGRDYGQNQFNRALSTSRQPGSSFKPIVYLAALESGRYTPVTRVVSEPTAFVYDEGRKIYRPHNFGNRYFGPIDLREAIQRSDNIYAVHTAMEIGPEEVIDMARRLGITSSMEPLPSLALGTFPVSPLEMAAAFGTIANQGVRVSPVAVLRITDSRGRVLYEAEPEHVRVIEPGYPYVLTKLMESVFEPGGTGYRIANRLHRPISGKTGTTNSDAWMVGFTPELAAAVWVGYDRGRNLNSLEAYLAAPIFADFMEAALAGQPPSLFPIPPGVVNVYIDAGTGLLASADCDPKEIRLETFVAGTEPLEHCAAHGGTLVPADPGPTGQPGGEERKAPRPSWWEGIKSWWKRR
jgi:1A family penicillin-binding protein